MAWPKVRIVKHSLDPLPRTRPFCSSAARCTSKVCAKSCIGVLNVFDMKAAEGKASDSSCDLFFTVRYLFILWTVEICHHWWRKYCLSRKKIWLHLCICWLCHFGNEFPSRVKVVTCHLLSLILCPFTVACDENAALSVVQPFMQSPEEWRKCTKTHRKLFWQPMF